MQVCNLAIWQLCKYASLLVLKYLSMQVCKYASVWVFKYTIMQVNKFASMLASTFVKVARHSLNNILI